MCLQILNALTHQPVFHQRFSPTFLIQTLRRMPRSDVSAAAENEPTKDCRLQCRSARAVWTREERQGERCGIRRLVPTPHKSCRSGEVPGSRLVVTADLRSLSCIRSILVPREWPHFQHPDTILVRLDLRLGLNRGMVNVWGRQGLSSRQHPLTTRATFSPP